MTRRIAVLLSLTFIALAAPACGSAPPPQMPPSMASPLANNPLPDFQRRSLDGAQVDTKGFRGRVVVVKFFAKYCEPCKKTLPAAQALAKEHAEVAFVGVAEDERESDVREVVGNYHLTFPIVHDRGNVLSGRYRVSEMPVTFVADRQGVIRWVGGPGQSEQDLANAVTAANATQ